MLTPKRIHFVFLIKDADMQARQAEFQYVQAMSSFFGSWIRDEFDMHLDVMCDMMTTGRRSILQRPDIHTLVQDHRERGSDTYHFYLTYFRPLWTDCTCEGYHAENFGMVWWQRPRAGSPDVQFMALKNCTAVSHVLAHELLRQKGHPKYVTAIHDIWTRHHYADLPFVGYGADHKRTDVSPAFLVIDTTALS